MRLRESQRLIRLKTNIEKDLMELEKLKSEMDGLDLENTHPRILGSIFHDFYTGIERIFVRISEELEGGLPKGESSHKDLLDGMTLELKDIRPKVIDDDLRDKLGEYLRFRHVFRSVYGFALSRERLNRLIDNFNDVFSDFNNSIRRFNAFLETLASGIERSEG